MSDAPVDVAKWSETVTADNAAATVTQAADSRLEHYVTSIHASFSVANVQLLTLKDGSTIVGNWHVNDQRDIVFAKPLRITHGAAVELSLAASGTPGQIGAVTMTGLSIGFSA